MSAPGPECSCGKATVQRAVKKDGPDKGRKFWSCAAWPSGCKFFQFQDDIKPPSSPASATCAASAASGSSSSGAACAASAASGSSSSGGKAEHSSPGKRRASLPGYTNYLSDWNTLRVLQDMMASSPNDLGHGRDYRETGSYDHLQVVGAWRVINREKQERYSDALREDPVATTEPVELRAAYAEATRQLPGCMDLGAGEAILLHGTDPRVLHSIMFEGLDPGVAAEGLFGRGTYFAEDAAKIDQYARVDVKYQKDGELSELHHRLYSSSSLPHPNRVCYALVCRVRLGAIVRTQDGRTQMSSDAPLFQDHARTSLAPFAGSGQIPGSIVAEKGIRIQRFREFIVFEPERIQVEYLVAYQRTQLLCHCGVLAVERTVVKEGPNRGRLMRVCAHPRESAQNCGFLKMLPECLCGGSAAIKTTQKVGPNQGRSFYCCPNSSCDWFGGWVEDPGFPSPTKRPRNGGV